MPRHIPITTHPGEVLGEDFLAELKMSPQVLAAKLRVPARTIRELVAERGSMTADLALRLERYFGVSAGFWLGLQADHDLSTARNERDYSHIRRRRGTSEKATLKKLARLEST